MLEEVRACSKLDMERIESAEIIIADNVFAYQNSMDADDLIKNGFHSMRLPFSPLWIEWRADLTTQSEDSRSHAMAAVIRQMGCIAYTLPDSCLPDDLRNQGIIPQGFSLWAESDGDPVYLGTRVVFCINQKGEFHSFHVVRKGAMSKGHEVRPFVTACLTIAFMHCKNVRKIDVGDTEGPSSKWLRRQKTPRLRYKVLDINPMKEVLRTEGQSETTGLHRALHICRGHFATYTVDKPLFGHFVGTVWKPAHTRGSIEQGAVVKDYRINPK